jgi:glucokinase
MVERRYAVTDGKDGGNILALDIGGTKMLAVLVDGSGRERRRLQVPTPSSRTGDSVQLDRALAELVSGVAGSDPVSAVGIASAGPTDIRAGTIDPVNIPGWRDFPIRDVLSTRFGGAPTVLVGDALAAAIGEYERGAGKGAASLLGIVVSTGIGGGLVLDGHPFAGASGNAGHFGHEEIEPAGERCGCGALGCLETVASGPAMVRWARARGWTGTDARELVASARAGDATALAALDRAAHGLATALAQASLLLDLDLVVVGGGVSAAGELLLEPVRRYLAEEARLAFVRRTRVVRAELGGDAGIVGAASEARRALARHQADTSSLV